MTHLMFAGAWSAAVTNANEFRSKRPVRGRVERSLLDREINGKVVDSSNNATENSQTYH